MNSREGAIDPQWLRSSFQCTAADKAHLCFDSPKCPSVSENVCSQPTSELPNLSAVISNLKWIILCYGSCPVHCRIFGNISGLFSLDAFSNPFTQCDTQKCLQTLPNNPQVRTTVLVQVYRKVKSGYVQE